MALSAESTATCPYNRAHTIVLARMQFHLTRCRQQYPNAEKTTCPFNSTHIVNKVELEWHLEWCKSRITGEREFFKFGSDSKAGQPTVEVDLNVPASAGEVWGEEETSGASVLAMVKEVSQTKPTLSNKICAPKAVRKQHKLDERRRFIEVFDATGRKAAEPKEEAIKPAPVPETQELPRPSSPQLQYQELPQPPTPRPQPAIARPQDPEPPSVSLFNDPEPSAWPQLQDAQNPSIQWPQIQEKRRQQVQQQQQQLPASRPPAQDKWHGWKSVEGAGQSLAQMKISETRDRTNPWGAQKPPTSNTTTNTSNDFPQLPVSGRGRRIF